MADRGSARITQRDREASRSSVGVEAGRRNADSVRVSLIIFWIACLVTLIMSHYAISARLNVPYKVMTVVVVVLVPFTAGVLSLVRKPAVLWLLLFNVILVLGYLSGYTGSPKDLFTVGSDPVVMVRVFPFMLCGYTLAQFPRVEKRWMLALLVAFALVTLPDAYTFARGSLQGLRRERLLTGTFDEASARAVLTGYVNLSLVCLLVAVLANRLRDMVTPYWRWVVAALQISLASICVTAGFTAAALLLLIALGLLGITIPVRTLRFRLLVFGGVMVVVAALWVGFANLAQGTGGTIGQVFSRLDQLRKAVSTREVTDETMSATSGRLELGAISIRSFLKSPLVGLGKGEESAEIKGHDSDTHGGHSYILDSLGQRGLVGTFPLLAALWLFLLTAYRNFRLSPTSWRESAMVTIMPVWIVAMIINPYFLGYLALNCVVFLCFGLILGDAVRLGLGSVGRGIATASNR